MGILPILTLLCTVFSVSMATETMTAEDSAESEVQRSSDEPAVSVLRSSCDSGWTLHANRCFRFFNAKATWTQAEGHCVRQGGHLASIHNHAESRLMMRLLRGWAWIGGFGGMKGSTWYWTDGTHFDYSHWNLWEPNNGDGNEHCIWILPSHARGAWNDAPCELRVNFVCAK